MSSVTTTAAINRSAPPVDDRALAVWADFLRFHATVTDVLERELAAAEALPLTWFDVLLQLQVAEGGRLRMQELAAAIVLSKSGLTRLVDRLERAGYVARASCPADRRGTFAEITPEGRRALAAARPIHLQGVADHFVAHLSDRQLKTLGEALTTLLRANREAPSPPDHAACGASSVSR